MLLAVAVSFGQDTFLEWYILFFLDLTEDQRPFLLLPVVLMCFGLQIC